MKHAIVFLLCLIVILSFSSCFDPHTSIDPESENPSSSDETLSTSDEHPICLETDYSDVIALYRKVIDACSIYDKENSDSFYAEKYGITDPQEKKFFSTFRYEAYKHHAGNGEKDCFSPIYKLTWGYAEKDLNGDGTDELILLNEDYTIIAIFSYVDGKPTVIGGLNESFPYQRPSLTDSWIDGEGYIYQSGDTGFEHKTKYKVAQGGASLEIIADYWLVERMEYEPEAHVVTEYYMLMGDEEIEITESEYKALDDQHGKYLGQYEGKDVTAEYAGLTFIPLFSETELLQSIYESVLNTETKVYEVATGEFKFLKDVRTPYEQTLLADVTDLLYGFADFDGDGIDELVLDYGDRFILQYNNRRVCLYAFTPDWENPQVNIEYSSMNKSWNDRLSKEEAHEIACKYLGISINGGSTGALGTTICYDTVVVGLPDETSVFYHVIYYSEYYCHHEEGWETRPPYEIYLDGEVLVNATTGECFKKDLKIRCEAIESVAKYWGIKKWESEINEGVKTVSSVRIADFAHCERPYHRVILEREYYVCHEDGSADATPYKVETLKEVFVDMWDNKCMESIDMISRDEAVAIAEIYWEDFDIEENVYTIHIENNQWERSFVVQLKHYVTGTYSIIDTLWIDKITGEVYTPVGK